MLGPLYGIFIVWLTSRWQDVFWINVPLALAAMVMIHFSLPSRDRSAEPEKIDIIGGLLLAITLGLAVIGLYNANPDGKHALPSYGPPLIIAAVVFAVIFFVWERFSRTKLIEPAGVHFRPFLSALGSSLCAGAALMVTLVDVELFAQGVLGKDQDHAAMMLLWFLAALPIGALVGGAIATKIGDRAVAFVGLLIAAGGYWLISKWSIDLLAERHNIFGLSLPALDTDLAIAGIGLGLVIAPLTSASLRVVPSAQHGIASAAVVVARMTGMLIGVAVVERVGLLPTAATRREIGVGGARGRQPRRARPASGHHVPRSVRRDVRRNLQGHRGRLRGGCAVGPVDRQPERARRRARSPGSRTRRASASRSRTSPRCCICAENRSTIFDVARGDGSYRNPPAVPPVVS